MILKSYWEKIFYFCGLLIAKMAKKIQLEDIRKYKIAGLVGKNTSRNMAHLIFKKKFLLINKLELMYKFNSELSANRDKYMSFF